MRVTCISDLHGNYPNLEGGDLLIIAGDLTANDTLGKINRFKDWLVEQGIKYKKTVMIAGNHDNWIQRRQFFNIDKSSWEHPMHSYLEDSGTEFSYFDERFPKEDEGFLPSGHRTLKIWGSPWVKRLKAMNPHCMAFTVDTEEELAEKWALIPSDTDILVTHGPPYGGLDRIKTKKSFECVGSKSLQMRSITLDLKLWVVGHIHESYGVDPPGGFLGGGDCKIINASHVNERYKPVNKPINVIL